MYCIDGWVMVVLVVLLVVMVATAYTQGALGIQNPVEHKNFFSEKVSK